jgi:hypothetical protein
MASPDCAPVDVVSFIPSAAAVVNGSLHVDRP